MAGPDTDPSDRSGESVPETSEVPAASEATDDPGVAGSTAADHGAHWRQRAGRRRQVVGWSMLGTGVFLLLSVIWVAFRSYEAYDHLAAASDEVSILQKDLEDFTDADPAQAAQTVQRLQQQTAAARSAVNDPTFRAATITPLVGANFDALRE